MRVAAIYENEETRGSTLPKASPEAGWEHQPDLRLAAPEIRGPITEAQQRKVVSALEAIPQRYRTEYPALFEEHGEQIAQAAKKLAQLYRGAAFPKMKVYPGMQPDLQTHEGCDRCHGVLVAASGPRKGETLSGDCTLCHAEPEILSGPDAE